MTPLSLSTIVAIVVHGVALLGDSYLHPSIADIAIPFVSSYKTIWTSLGIVAGWGLILLGLSYYARRWVGAVRWRKLHRFTALAWLAGPRSRARRGHRRRPGVVPGDDRAGGDPRARAAGHAAGAECRRGCRTPRPVPASDLEDPPVRTYVDDRRGADLGLVSPALMNVAAASSSLKIEPK